MSDEAVFAYKCSEYYHPEDEGGIAWDDPTVRVQWPLCGQNARTFSKRQAMGLRCRMRWID